MPVIHGITDSDLPTPTVIVQQQPTKRRKSDDTPIVEQGAQIMVPTFEEVEDYDQTSIKTPFKMPSTYISQKGKTESRRKKKNDFKSIL